MLSPFIMSKNLYNVSYHICLQILIRITVENKGVEPLTSRMQF